MIHLVIAPIVEGHGEVAALPILLRRIGQEYCPDTFVEVLQPIRQPASSLVKTTNPSLHKAVSLATGKLAAHSNSVDRKLILIVIDAEGRCAANLGPELKMRAEAIVGHMNISSVIAVDEYETWFVAAAESLSKYINASPDEIPLNPETTGTKKKWIDDRYRGVKYSETVDQPKFSSAMDLRLCRSRSPSFDKLCRDIERMAILGDDVAVI